MTQHDLLLQLVEVRIKRILAREGKQYERNFYIRVGRGVTPQEYSAILHRLVRDGVVTRGFGERGVSVLQWVKQPELSSGTAVAETQPTE